ncbi:MAG TPA: murein biosynthesis integral membrane protein MurJ [Anaerolineales bacterium]|nr:murein biosynthesis integral membrane protein MurJ [Anaerolineales bacterium]
MGSAKLTTAAVEPPRRFSFRRRLSPIAWASLQISLLFAIDKALGVFRQAIIGRQFGVSAELDAFNAANNVPDLLFAMISGGALGLALIPVLSATLEKEGRPALWALFSRVANWVFLITAGLAILVGTLAGPIVRGEFGVAPGFEPELQTLVVSLMRLNLIATLLFSLSGIVVSGLQSNRHFFLPALAPIVYDLGQIFGALVLAPTTPITLGPITLPAAGLGVHGLVYGVILGAALHLGVQIPGLIRYRFRWTPSLDRRDPGLLRVARLMGPRVLTIGAFQLIFIIQDNLASRLAVGSVTALTFGWLIMQLPETLIATAIATALLPTISGQHARRDAQAFEALLARAVRVLTVLAIPVAALFLYGMEPLVQIVFGFDPAGTALVAAAARAYMLGLLGHSLLEVGARAFYSQQDARTPLRTTLIGLTTFAVSAALLFRPLGAVGIALSNSIAFSLEAAILLFLLRRTYPSIGRIGRPVARAVLSAGVACGAAALLGVVLPSGAFATFGALAIGAAAAVPLLLPELRLLAAL